MTNSEQETTKPANRHNCPETIFAVLGMVGETCPYCGEVLN